MLWKGDKIFFIKSDGEEAFAMDKLLILINQLALNEYNGFIKKGLADKEMPFFFEDAVKEIISFGKKSIDLLDEKNDSFVEEFCKKYGLNYTKWKQTKLEIFNGGNKK